MLQVAAEVIDGRRVPIVRVPVLTPRLSSYWLALVTDVDVTTGRNLIDSMGTEVVVTDHSIREIVPGRAAAVRRGGAPRARRGRARARRRAQPKSSGSRNSIDTDQVTWVRIGAEDAAGGPALAGPTTTPSSTAAKASITLPVASVASA